MPNNDQWPSGVPQNLGFLATPSMADIYFLQEEVKRLNEQVMKLEGACLQLSSILVRLIDVVENHELRLPPDE